MARSHGRIKVEIWGDPDFRALTKDQQRAYFMLLSQGQINNCGVLDYTPTRFSRLAADETITGVDRTLQGLHDARFIVIDDDTEEILIRTYVEHDGILSSPNMKKAAQREYHSIVSRPLREVLAEGFPEVFGELFRERFGEPPSLNYSRNGFPRARPAPPPPTGLGGSRSEDHERSGGFLPPNPSGEETSEPHPHGSGSLALAGSRSPSPTAPNGDQPPNHERPPADLEPDPEGLHRLAQLLASATEPDNPHRRNTDNPNIQLTDQERNDIQQRKNASAKRIAKTKAAQP